MAKLYHFPLDPFSRRARLALGEYGSEVELIEERPWENRPGFIEINPAGFLPVYIDDNGTQVLGIEAVGEYFEDVLAGPGRATSLLGKSPAQRAETRRLVAWFDRRLHRDVTWPIVAEKIERRFANQDHGSSAVNMNAVRAALKKIRFHLDFIGDLVDRRSWIAGDDLSLADLAAGAHLSCVDYLGDVPWSANEAARTWYQRLKSRPSFRPLLADHVRGMPPPRSYGDLDF
jgi:glutathione S-transferase